MTRILCLFLMLCALPAMALDRITATITITNTPANNDTFTVNGDVRTWKTSVTIPATQISITNVVGYSATNLFNQASAYLYSGPLTLSYSSTNGIKLVGRSGNALVVSASGTWATITMSTQLVTGMIPVRTPISGEPTASVRTNIASDLVQAESDYSTVAFDPSSTAVSNLVNRTTAQTITGAKTFNGANVYSNDLQTIVGGYSTNLGIVNSPIISGNVDVLSGGTYSAPTFINAVNTGDPIRSPGTGINSEQFGNGTEASDDYAAAFGNSAIASGNRSVAIGSATAASGASSSAIGYVAMANAQSSSALGAGSFVDTGYDYSTAVGQSATATATHQVILGTSSESVSIPGNLQVDGSISNAAFSGSVTLNNELIVAAFNNVSLASGNNSGISASTNSYVTLATGPSALFTIAGIAGGVSGRVVTFENTTGQSMVLANESGLDATSANRIRTGLSGDYTLTNNPGVVSFRYNGTLSRWVLISHN